MCCSLHRFNPWFLMQVTIHISFTSFSLPLLLPLCNSQMITEINVFNFHIAPHCFGQNLSLYINMGNSQKMANPNKHTFPH